MTRRRWLLFLALAALLAGGFLLIPGADYRFEPENPAPASFAEYLERVKPRHATRPDNGDRVLRFSDEPTELAILYIHGFGASRGEGELVVDAVAENFQANTYYMRVPGHGTDKDDLNAQTPESYLDGVERALRAMPLLGRKVVVIGTSFGGLLATHLAARHPDEIAGLILVSPFYEFRPLDARIMGNVFARPLVRFFIGDKLRVTRRDPAKPPSPDDPRGPGYHRFWYNEKYTGSYLPLAELRDMIVRRDTFARMSMPVLLLYYYRDEEHQDPSVSVRAMLDRFSEMGRSPSGRGPTAGHPLNRAIAVENGAHVMTSEHVKSDHETPRREMEAFIADVLTRYRAGAANNEL